MVLEELKKIAVSSDRENKKIQKKTIVVYFEQGTGLNTQQTGTFYATNFLFVTFSSFIGQLEHLMIKQKQILNYNKKLKEQKMPKLEIFTIEI